MPFNVQIKMTRRQVYLEKFFENISEKGLISRIYTKLKQLNKDKISNPIKNNGPIIWTYTSELYTYTHTHVHAYILNKHSISIHKKNVN